jgi:hypothetical protein
VLLIDASLHSTSNKTVQDLSAGKWVDEVLPIIAASNSEGQMIQSVWTNGLHMPSATISTELGRVATGSAQAYQQAVHLKPPAEMQGAAGLLEACLLSRSQGAAELRKSMVSFLTVSAKTAPQSSPTTTPLLPATTTTTPVAATTPSAATTVVGGAIVGGTAGAAAGSTTVVPASTVPPPTTTTTVPVTTTTAPSGYGTAIAASPEVSATAASIATAANDIKVGDQAYKLFLSTVGERMPPSQWLADPAPYNTTSAEIFLTTLHNAVAATQVNEVRIFSVNTLPAPVSEQAGVQVLPQSTFMYTTIVVADTGNQPATGLTVTAAISPVGLGAASVRDFVDLQPGQSHTIQQLGPLAPPQGVPVTVTVTVTPPAGSPVPATSRTLVIEMPTPNSTPTTSSTTSTTAPASLTSPTVPGGATTVPGG